MRWRKRSGVAAMCDPRVIRTAAEVAERHSIAVPAAHMLSNLIAVRVGVYIEPQKLMSLLIGGWDEIAPLAHKIHSHERRRSDRRK